LVEAGDTHAHRTFKEEHGRMAMTILIKMMPSDGRKSFQRHLREHVSKTKSYDDLEEELFAELLCREADGDKTGSGGLNQLSEPEMAEDNEKEEKKERRKTSHQSHVYLWLRTRVCVGEVAWWVVF
jgi:hypothetical protein